MAIEKVPFPSSVAGAVTDYQKQNALLAALVKAVDGAQKIVGGNIVQGAVFNVGGTLYVATADTAITGVASDYVKLTPSGDTLTLAPSYVASLAGVAWNAEYKGYYDGSGNLYEFDEAKAYNAAIIAAMYKSGITKDRDIAANSILVSNMKCTAGEYVLDSFDNEVLDESTGGVYEEQTRRLYCSKTGVVRIRFRAREHTAGYSSKAKIYKNGSPAGTERINTTSSWVEYSEDLSVSAGDYFSIYVIAAGYGIYIDRFRISIAEVI